MEYENEDDDDFDKSKLKWVKDFEGGLEYEILMSSIDYLRKHKPVLMIEVHNNFLKEQGLDFNKVFEKLKNIGYKLAAKDTKRFLQEDSHIILN